MVECGTTTDSAPLNRSVVVK